MNQQDSHVKLAQEYFDELARRFPVMCASDEFHFLPRSQSAASCYDKLDNLDSQAIKDSIENLKSYQKAFARLEHRQNTLETRIDLQLLQANIAGFIIEFDQKQIWQFNPLLYLKIAFIGLDHALNKPANSRGERAHRVLARLSEAHRVLGQALKNITSVPVTYHQASISMTADCKRYLKWVGKNFGELLPGKTAQYLPVYLKKTEVALEALDRFLASLTPRPDRDFAVQTLSQTLSDHFLSGCRVDEIYQMAVEDWNVNLELLQQLGAKIDPASSWLELYHGYFPSDIEKSDTMSLYKEEIERLKSFFNHQGFRAEDLNTPLEIAETPDYLRSVRGTASFAAAFSSDIREKSFFYITTQLAGHTAEEVDTLLKKRFHREFKLLAAHETIPGHHYLDAVRRKLANPVRRQIESPLFYEGWASYAESMLVDLGYISSPMDLMVDYKRRLWRSARCQIDVGITTDKLRPDDAVELLGICGFSRQEAHRQVDRFRLNPGYQLCYSLGCQEFQRLKATYGGQMDTTRFHNLLLDGGELPFHLIALRFDEILTANR